MVDLATFHKMHPGRTLWRRLPDDLGPEIRAQEDPPEGDFVLLLPKKVHGLNILENKWVMLNIDQVSPIN